MPSITSLVSQLAADYPDISFSSGERFHWQPDTRSITYPKDSDDTASLLHEAAHALLGHQDFTRDIALIEMERDAWEYAITTLAPRYRLSIAPSLVQESLDTYRDWLHARSICPLCHATGVQIQRQTYRCLACGSEWTVNDARQHALRRHLTKKRSR